MFKEPDLKTETVRKPQKRKAKTPRQEPSKKARLGETYKDYVQFAEQLQREATFGALPFWILGVLGFLFNSQLANFIARTWVSWDFASRTSGASEYARQLLLADARIQSDMYAQMVQVQVNTEFTLWIFSILMMIAGFVWAQRSMTRWVTEEAKYTPGFKEFFQRGYGFFRKGRAWGRYWPKDLPKGERLEEFRRIIRES